MRNRKALSSALQSNKSALLIRVVEKKIIEQITNGKANSIVSQKQWSSNGATGWYLMSEVSLVWIITFMAVTVVSGLSLVYKLAIIMTLYLVSELSLVWIIAIFMTLTLVSELSSVYIN